MKNYHIYVRSNEHPRTINHYANSRCYYTKHTVQGKDALIAKVAELQDANETVTDIRTDLGTRIWL